MRKSTRKFSRVLLLSFSLIFFSAAAFAQNAVTGKVTDSKDGSPAAGITVTVKGTRTATQTAADGGYKINAAANSTLVFSGVGFARQEIAVTGRTTVDASLVQANQQMNEVVVVAYGTRRRGDLTSAITAVNAKDFQKGAIASSEQLLQGKVAGLQITTGGGAAGGGSTIRIRGGASLNASNNPLIVIDGVPVDNNDLPGSANFLNTINPNDIESISVLKDASATALYGSRASNGVIIITTKKGTKGKVLFNFNTRVSAGMIAKKVDVLTADQIRDIINADAAATGSNTFKNLLGSENTDWQSQIYQTAIGFDNNLSASGTFAKIPFRISGGYLNQDGILKTDHFERLSAALSLTPKLLNDHLSITLNAKYSNTKNRFADGGAVGAAASFDPTQPVMDVFAHGAGRWGGYYEWLQPGTTLPMDLATRNPVALLELRHNTSNVNRILGNVQLDYKLHFFPDLHIQANLGMDYATGKGNDNKDSTLATSYSTKGSFLYYTQNKTDLLAEVSLFYTKEIKKHKLDVLALHGYQDFVTNESNYPTYSQDGTVLGGGTVSKGKPEYILESYLGRINYSYNNKFYLSGSLRRDESSKFSSASNLRTSYFPAVSGAWKLKEDLFKNTNVVNEFKLRLSWGITGNQEISGIPGASFNPLYPYLPVYAYSNSAAQYQFGNTFYSYLRPRAYDPKIKWETTTTTNLGLDFAFLNNRISGSVDIYNKKTKDLIGPKNEAPGQNFDILIFTNIGDLTDKGVEFTLNTTPVKTKNVTWDFGFNASYNHVKITDLGLNTIASPVSGISGGTGNQIGVNAVGYTPYTFAVYKQIYDASTGKPIEGLYDDMNRDGVIDSKDMYYYKKPAPDVLLGINTQVSYKKWSLGAAAHGSFGNYLYNNYNSNSSVLRSIKNPINFISNASVSYLDAGFVNNQYLSDYYIENASFLRLDNINIGFNAGKLFNKKASLRLTGSVQNVVVITKYSGLDPENSSINGVDNNIYPRPRIFSLGANLDF